MPRAKRVLLISYFFAPSPAVGAIRAIKFYEYLPAFGWEPYVLTVCPITNQSRPDLPRVFRTNYISPWKWLERRRARSAISNQSTTWTLRQASHKSSCLQKVYFLLRHLLPMSSVRMPDATLGWFPFAVKTGLAMLHNQEFDVIWSSAGPPTSHLVAARLHHLTGIPWVADFRDPWSLNHQEKRLAVFDTAEARLERRILSGAACIVTVSQGFAQLLSTLHQRPVEVVYNGYDENDTRALPRTFSVARSDFNVRYTGALYPGQQDVQPFLQALYQAREQESDFSPRVQFVGPELAWLAQTVEEYGLSDIIECREPVTREEAKALQQDAMALLLFGWNDANRPGIIPSKVYEYMRTGRPILEVGQKQSEVASIIANCRAGLTAIQPEEIQRLLLTWWQEFCQTGRLAWQTDLERVAAYSHQTQTARLAEILNSCTEVEKST